MGSLRVDKNFFISRASRIYEAWNNEEVNGFGDLEALCFMVGIVGDAYSKSLSLQHWLFNCNLQDTLLVLTKTDIYILGSDKKAKFFLPLEAKNGEKLHPSIPPFHILMRDKANKDKQNFEKLIDVVKKCGGKFGCFEKEKPDSEFGNLWKDAVQDRGLESVDVSLQFGMLFAIKDEKEIAVIRKSAEATVTAWNHLRKKLVDVVDAEKKIRHNKLADELEKAITATHLQGRLAQDKSLETCFTPVIQSGATCNVKFSSENNDKTIHYGSIIGLLGLRYLSYCTNVGRTLMVEPSQKMQDVYDALLNIQNTLLENLRPGRMLSDVYRSVMDYTKKNYPDLVQYLVKNNFGFGTGIEFRESHLVINDKCRHIVKANMTFILTLIAQNFPNPQASDPEFKTATVVLSDTVLIAAEGPADVLTAVAKSRLRSNTIRIRRESDEENRVRPDIIADQGRAKRSVILQEQTRHKLTNEEKRKDHQKELSASLNEAAKARLAHLPGAENVQKVKKSNVSYKAQEKFPNESEVNECRIFVDKKHDTVILPIFGMPVPFHISMLKNTSLIPEGEYSYLRINFAHPGSQIGKDSLLFPNPLADFVKELSYRSSNSKEPGEMHAPSLNLQTAYRLIKEMQKRFRTMEAEQREKEGAVKQDKLVTSTNANIPKLKSVYVRPNIVQKRMMGVLEAHVNGFRYLTARGDKIDVLYNNIKHAFFQPCDNEMIILLHFHLKNPVLWGKKKYLDIQFYTEVGEITTDLGKMHHMQDRDDVASEQMEREMRRKLNSLFQSFCDKVARATADQVEFETPFNELGFTGVPYRSSVTLKPTSTCLVNLTEMPSFVITLDEVELVHFERVTGNTKSFDMVIVFKDYQRKVHSVAHIPGHSLDSVKDWLNSCDIRYTEGPVSLNWNSIMKTIVNDPENFFEDGGWNFLNAESDNEGADEETDESEYSASEVSDESDDDSDGGGSGSEEITDESSESEAELDSDESEGKDWSDLEEEAAKADRAKELGEDNPSRKRKGGHAPAPPQKRRR